MIIKRKKKGFEPITITINSKEEAMYLKEVIGRKAESSFHLGGVPNSPKLYAKTLGKLFEYLYDEFGDNED